MHIKCSPISLISRKIPILSSPFAMSRLHTDRRPSQMQGLSRLPIPRLHDTLQRYLASLEPFLLEDEAKGGESFQDAMRRRVSWAEQFEKDIGSTLQDRLIELDKSSPNNWLDDNFWLDKAYLEWRAPLLINSNWWLVFKHDSNIPVECIRGAIGKENSVTEGVTPWQIRRASWLTSRILDYKEQFESGNDKDLSRTGLWLQNTVPRMFNVCRIPETGKDRLLNKCPDSPYYKTIVVMVHEWMYSVDVYDDNTQKNVGFQEIERRIRDIVLDAQGRLSAGEKAIAVGLLSSDDRDAWATNRQHLMRCDPTNQNSLRAIEESVLVLCLDDTTLKAVSPEHELRSHLHAIRSGIEARNRWFDKAISVIVDPCTRAGMMGEHSPVDALVPSIVAEYALVDEVPAGEIKSDHQPNSVRNKWHRLDWVIDGNIQTSILKAYESALAAIEDSDDDVFWFSDFGSDWIKNTARLSPDGFVQLAMLLAWYRTQGSFTATYETALTRLYHHGRTETIRTLSRKSRAFVLSMLNAGESRATKEANLRSAIHSHSVLTREAATGKGIDRHLLGLRLLMKDGEKSDLFSDELFGRSQEWKLSTSGLSAGAYFRGTGFGSTYHDGYGINYLLGPNVIKFGIESKYSCKRTSTSQYWEAIRSSLIEMYMLLEGQDSLRPHL